MDLSDYRSYRFSNVGCLQHGKICIIENTEKSHKLAYAQQQIACRQKWISEHF